MVVAGIAGSAGWRATSRPRSSIAYGNVTMIDAVAHDGLVDAAENIAMGTLTERQAALFK